MNENITLKEITAPSSDGIHTLLGRLYLPSESPKGLFHVVHGMTEYIGRYDGFMRSICAAGYAVAGFDNLGHGNTAGPGELGFIAPENGWDHLARDVEEMRKSAAEIVGADLPYFLMGHSMGSFIVRVSAGKYVTPRKLVVMGTGGPNPATGAGKALVKLTKKAKGDKYVSKFLDNMAFGAYNKKFKDEDDVRAWLTKDRSVREKYDNDPFCNYKFTVSAMGDLLELTDRCNKAAWLEDFPDTMPVLLVSGTDDPVGDYGKGVQKVYESLKKNGKDVTMKLYENNRHEILNDTAREEVIRDILAFIGA
ncbi:MAG: alpha/beta fold hydrolase [Clostridia bacterium]|nr:alpha/beta fold hydrolase [Clostridia bacterium]